MLISNNLIDEKQRIYLNKLSQEELFKQAITTMEKWFHDAAYYFIELNGRANEKKLTRLLNNEKFGPISACEG